jgi:hypothetical protein
LNSFKEGKYDEDIEETVGSPKEWEHAIRDLTAKKNRVIAALDKRIKTTLIM